MRADLALAGRGARAYHGVAQLPDVAGPGRPREQVDRFRREAGRVGGIEVHGQGRDVLPALAQRWNRDLETAQPVVEVFP